MEIRIVILLCVLLVMMGLLSLWIHIEIENHKASTSNSDSEIYITIYNKQDGSYSKITAEYLKNISFG